MCGPAGNKAYPGIAQVGIPRGRNTLNGRMRLFVTVFALCVQFTACIEDAVVTTLAGKGLPMWFGSADGIGTNAGFVSPQAIAATADGAYLYIGEADGHQIRKVVVESGEVSTLAGSGTSGSTDGVGTIAQITNPTGMA
eukprot:5130849-Pyramimonas_sp.AAC.1